MLTATTAQTSRWWNCRRGTNRKAITLNGATGCHITMLFLCPLRGLEIYKKHAKRKPHGHNIIVYTLVNFDTTLEQDFERIYTLRSLGFWAYVMVYNKPKSAPIYRKLQRWVNNRFIFAKCDNFNDYLKNQSWPPLQGWFFSHLITSRAKVIKKWLIATAWLPYIYIYIIIIIIIIIYIYIAM